MSELESILEQLRRRGDELKALGPGKVEVARVTDIATVRVLRRCREELSPAEQLEIRQAIVELEAHLHGIVVAPPLPPKGWLQRVMDRFSAGLSAATASGGQPADGGPAGSDDGGPIPLPAPAALLDAAEAWAVAELARGRVGADVDLDALTAPWLEATVTAQS